MTLFQNKYRIETARLQTWDYSSDGSYFITICTKGRKHLFGKIINGKMQLNKHGQIVEQCWFNLIHHYPNLILDAFVIMPNHIHGIMIIDNTRSIIKITDNGDVDIGLPGPDSGGMDDRDSGDDVTDDHGAGDDVTDDHGAGDDVETGFKPVSTDQPYQPDQPDQPDEPDQPYQPYQPVPPPKPKKPTPRRGISEFVRALKTFSSRRMNEMDHTAGKTRWQERFHDHIIRNEQELHRIQRYIINNPSNWDNDTFKT